MTISRFLNELARRGLLRAAVLYTIFAWLLLQAALWICPNLSDPETGLRGFALVAVAGLPVALAVAWFLGGRGARPNRRFGTAVTVVSMLAVVLVAFFQSPRQSAFADARDTTVAASLPVADSLGFPAQSGHQAPGAHGLLRAGERPEADSSRLLLKVRGLRIEAGTGWRGVQAELFLCTRLVNTKQQGRIVRIEAWLVNTADGATLWSERYEGDPDDLDGIHRKLFRALREGMQVTLPGSSEGQIVVSPQPPPQGREG